MHAAATKSSAATVSTFEQFVIPNYRRYPVNLVHGEGSLIWDAEGNRYLDLFPGWGCNILGHCPPRVVEAIRRQVQHLIHVPNTWHLERQGEFAEALCTRSFGQAFFCNSGAEAIEAAIKLARLHHHGERYEIITFENGFHGRTFGALTATAQPKYHAGLGPMLPGFQYAPINDLDRIRALVNEKTAAVLIEPVQGEGGINLPTREFLQGLRALCDERGLLLMFDEVQTCMGRTGNWFGYQTVGVQPDVLTLAKGLAGGVACGGMIARREVAASLRPGTHACTFGGNPLAMAAGLAVVETIEAEGLLAHAAAMGRRFESHFRKLAAELPIIRDVRVCGLMIGIDLSVSATPVVAKCLERGVLINATHDTVVRMLPALGISEELVDEGAEIVAAVLRELAAS